MTTLEQGQKAPRFELEDYQGQTVALSDLDNYDGVLVIFMCNHCPYVQAEVPEIKKLNDEFSSIAIVGINPNAETHPMDSEKKMPEFVEEKGLDSPHFYYLSDPDQEVAKEFGAECTPDPFLLDMRHRLFYHSKLNDKAGPDDEVEDRYMKEAIQKMLKKQDPPEAHEEPVGCSIKWKE
ncbi:redoxin domain-containing protein [Candidatus Nanohaloarchaea archaeon]|nr:redoxin domain-containing protein [Candidatus Nanohaloarchaea archaeon]